MRHQGRARGAPRRVALRLMALRADAWEDGGTDPREVPRRHDRPARRRDAATVSRRPTARSSCTACRGWRTTGSATSRRAPHTVRILLENLLRRAGSRDVTDEDVAALAAWPAPARDLAFMPARVLMQDFTGVPAVVDLAALAQRGRARRRRPRRRVNPLVPVDLVIDHSVQVDLFRTPEAYAANVGARVRAQRRALPTAALGAAGVRGPPRRPARRGDLPPGEPGASRSRGAGPRRRRVPGHARGHRLPHDDDQRPRRPGVGRRRDRGRGGDARPADVPAAPGRDRRPGDRGRSRPGRRRPTWS